MYQYFWWSRNPATANHLECKKKRVNNGINYQPQLVSRISSIDGTIIWSNPKTMFITDQSLYFGLSWKSFTAGLHVKFLVWYSTTNPQGWFWRLFTNNSSTKKHINNPPINNNFPFNLWSIWSRYSRWTFGPISLLAPCFFGYQLMRKTDCSRQNSSHFWIRFLHSAS